MGKILGFILFLNIFFLLPQKVLAYGDVLYDSLSGSNDTFQTMRYDPPFDEENEYFYTGSTFLATTTLEVGSIAFSIEALYPDSATTTNDVVVFIFEGSTTTPRNLLSLTAVSLYEHANYGSASTTVFDFVEPVIFVANKQYLIEVRPMAYEDVFFHKVYGKTVNTSGNFAYQYFNRDPPFTEQRTYQVGMRMYSYIQTYESPTISLDIPCVVNSLDLYPCTYGYASTSILEVHGSSTSYQSWYTDTYDVYVGLFDTNDRLITYRTITNPLPAQSFNFYTTLEWDDPYENLAQIKVCQVPSDGSANFNENDCAFVILGYDLSTASTTEYATKVGFFNEVKKTPDFQKQKDSIWSQYGCDDLGLTDVFPAIQCGFIWAFYPSNNSLQKFSRTTDLMLSLYPIGYGTIILDDVTDAFSTTSTSVFDKDIEVKKYFGMSGGTTTISVDHLLSKTGFADPVVDFIETILWLIFGGWLLMFSLTRKL